MRYLSIKNLKKHQHYKNRRPPWIKLHAEIFDDYTVSCLRDASKLHFIYLTLLASQMDNRIPYDLAFIARKIGASEVVDVEELILQGLIEVSPDDGKALAERKQMPIVETETEAEAKKRQKKIVSASGDAKRSNWVADFCADYTDATEGLIPPGELGRALKQTITTHGLEETRSRWNAFIRHADVKFGASYFAKHFGNYKPESRFLNGDAEILAHLKSQGAPK